MTTVPVVTEPALEAPEATPQRGPRLPLARWLSNPWGKPRFLVGTTWLYIAWALLPVILAIVFSFNAGRSRSVWQGFSIRWWWGDPVQSIFHDPDYSSALTQSLKLAAIDMVIATPLGVMLALGLARWRGRGAGTSNLLMLMPLVTPELVMAVSLLLVFTQIAIVPFSLVHLGTTAQIVGQVTFSLSYVVVIVRSRLASIGGEYEEAARDLGATRWGAPRLVPLPLLLPAILASMLIVFALSIDDFVVTQYMSAGYSTITIPMYLYANARGGATTPALNALATILVVVTLVGIALAYLVYTRLGRRTTGRELSALGAISGMEAA
jgi:spermidine/putrescine transport system permease protein